MTFLIVPGWIMCNTTKRGKTGYSDPSHNPWKTWSLPATSASWPTNTNICKLKQTGLHVPGLRDNVGKAEMIMIKNQQKEQITLNGKVLQEMNTFTCLGIIESTTEGIEEYTNSRPRKQDSPSIP